MPSSRRLLAQGKKKKKKQKLRAIFLHKRLHFVFLKEEINVGLS
jgi:hypothetical protein